MKPSDLLSTIKGQINPNCFFTIICIFLAIYLFLVSRYVTANGLMVSSDSVGYMADGLKVFNNWNLLPTISFSMIYPLLIAIFLKLGFSIEQAAILPINLSYALLIIPLYFIGEGISNKLISLASCIIFVISPDFIIESAQPLTGMLFLFFSVCATYYLILYIKYEECKFAFISGIFCMLTASTRIIGATLLLTGLIIVISGSIKRGKFQKDMVAFVSPLIPWLFWIYMSSNKGRIANYGSNDYVGYWYGNTINAAIYRFFDRWQETALYSGSEFILILVFLIFSICIIYIYKSGRLLNYIYIVKLILIYIFLHVSVLFLVTSDLWFGFSRIQTRYIVVVIPFIALLFVSAFHFTYKCLENLNKNRAKNILKFVLVACFFILIIQQISIYQSTIKEIRTNSENSYLDSGKLSSYISKYNITPNDRIYIDLGVDFSRFRILFLERNIYKNREWILYTMSNKTILDNLTVGLANDIVAEYSDPFSSSRSLASLIKENKNFSTYILLPLDISEYYYEKPPNDVCLINPEKFSKSIIYEVVLKKKNNESCDFSA